MHDDAVKVYTRRGADWTKRFPRVVAALRAAEKPGSMPSFALLHSQEYDDEVTFLAFDPLEHEGAEVRKLPLTDRKKRLQRLLAKTRDGMEFNDHIAGDG